MAQPPNTGSQRPDYIPPSMWAGPSGAKQPDTPQEIPRLHPPGSLGSVPVDDDGDDGDDGDPAPTNPPRRPSPVPFDDGSNPPPTDSPPTNPPQGQNPVPSDDSSKPRPRKRPNTAAPKDNNSSGASGQSGLGSTLKTARPGSWMQTQKRAREAAAASRKRHQSHPALSSPLSGPPITPNDPPSTTPVTPEGTIPSSTHSSPLSDPPDSPGTPPGPAGDWAPSTPPIAAAPSVLPALPSQPILPPLLSPNLPPITHYRHPPQAPVPALLAAPQFHAAPQYYVAPQYYAAPPSYYDVALAGFVQFSREHPAEWESLIGLYFQEEKRNPHEVVGFGPRRVLGGLAWQINARKLDMEEKNPGSTERWGPPSSLVSNIIKVMSHDDVPAFEEAIRLWSERTGRLRSEYVVERAGWKRVSERLPAWTVIHNIIKMDEGKERDDLLAAAKRDSPRFFAECMADRDCGAHKIKRKRPFHEDDILVVQYYNGVRVERAKPLPDAKRQIMTADDGRPTQFHAVPVEERAYDSKGNRLPWAHVWADDHPNASQNPTSKEPIETGGFGKRSVRKGSSLRASRTTTPAKKENPTLDGFAKALEFDRRKAEAEAREQASASTSKPQKEMNVASHNPPSIHKEPTRVMLYGYPAGKEYAAIAFYEKVSFGMICEDYERKGISEHRRYPGIAPPIHSRPLTAAERKMAMKYEGGEHWIKVTFDSAEAADRAIAASPHLIDGYWVYAQRFTGQAPERDEPIYERPEDREPGPLGARRPAHPPSQSLGRSSSISQQPMQQRASTTLPRGFATPHITPQRELEQAPSNNSPSLSTASSATATARVIATPRQRTTPSSDVITPASAPRRTFTHFPDIPRNYIHPPEEALLPVPTWSERMLHSLTTRGWIPGDIIGDVVPRLENGDFDWDNASFWWRFCFWFDGKFGTDLCGMHD